MNNARECLMIEGYLEKKLTWIGIDDNSKKSGKVYLDCKETWGSSRFWVGVTKFNDGMALRSGAWKDLLKDITK